MELSKEQVLVSHFKNTISPAIFDRLEDEFHLFRACGSRDGQRVYESRMFPNLNSNVTLALLTRLKREEREKSAAKAESEAEMLERNVAQRVEKALKREENKLRRNVATLLSKELSAGDDD